MTTAQSVTEIRNRIKLAAVSSRAKLILLGLLIAAILYVLISPLPELAATSSLNVHLFSLVILIIILITPPGAEARHELLRNLSFWREFSDFLDRSCVRLC
jgi:hypothetical protein